MPALQRHSRVALLALGLYCTSVWGQPEQVTKPTPEAAGQPEQAAKPAPEAGQPEQAAKPTPEAAGSKEDPFAGLPEKPQAQAAAEVPARSWKETFFTENFGF